MGNHGVPVQELPCARNEKARKVRARFATREPFYFNLRTYEISSLIWSSVNLDLAHWGSRAIGRGGIAAPSTRKNASGQLVLGQPVVAHSA